MVGGGQRPPGYHDAYTRGVGTEEEAGDCGEVAEHPKDEE
jgi:hypothetical protein